MATVLEELRDAGRERRAARAAARAQHEPATKDAPERLIAAIRAARAHEPAYTLQEIADVLGVTRQAVQQLLKRRTPA